MNVEPPAYLTSGSPNTCGNTVVPMVLVPVVIGSWPPSTNVWPPSSEYANPETDSGFSAKPRVSFMPTTTCWPVLSTAIAGSADEYQQASDRGLRAPTDPSSHILSSPEADQGIPASTRSPQRRIDAWPGRARIRFVKALRARRYCMRAARLSMDFERPPAG